METRILIPNGLRIVTTTSIISKEVGEEDIEEKPSSSSGHCETSDHDHGVKGKTELPERKSSFERTNENLSYSSNSSSSSSSEEESEEDDNESPTNLIGSSESKERGRKRGRSAGATRRRRKRRKETPDNASQGDPMERGHETTSGNPTQVKICATRVIEKGTVFAANDGDVQVVHLTGIPAIGKDDIRFLFGCFETISSLPPTTSSTPPHEITSASTSTSPFDLSSSGEDKKLIRLCNWIRFLPSSSTNLKLTDFDNCGNVGNDKGHERDRDFRENKTIVDVDFSVKPSSSNFVNDCGPNNNKGRKCNNIIARFVDGRPIFEVIARLVPGTEIVAYFDMESVITQASSISPFAAMMMISNMQMVGMPMSSSSSSSGGGNISSTSTSTTTPSSTLISSSSSSSHLATLGGVDVTLKSVKNERDGSEDREEKQQRLFQFYHNTFPSPRTHLHQFSHNPFGIQAYGSWLKNSSGASGDGGKEEKKEEGEGHERKRRKAVAETPLDLSKLSSSSPTLEDEESIEPLKIGTPFDSPDSNNEEILCPINIKSSGNSNNPRESPESRSGSSSIFSIKNVLRKQSSPKLFQPYCLEEKNESHGHEEATSRHDQHHPFRTSSLATPPSSSDSPMTVVIRTSQKIGPILRTRGRERSLLPCEVCGKAFDRPSLLKRHLRTHTGEKPHICDVCSKGFSTSSSLNTHRRIHSGEKPHQCPICGKRFTASSNLYYHRMTHNKEKPHKCLLCGKSFPTPGDLKSHQYVHSGSWPYTCPVCHRGFSKQTNLRNHLLLHSGITGGSVNSKMVEKPHACHLCDKKFTQACNLRAHLQSHEESDQKLFSCSVCKQSFPQTMILEGKCQNCMMSISSHHVGSRGIGLGGSIRKQSTSPPPSHHLHHQFSQKLNPVQIGKQSIFDHSLLHHRTSTPEQSVGASMPLPTVPNLNSFHLGGLALPHLPGFPLPTGLGLSASSSPFPQSTSSPSVAAAAAAASLFRASPSGGAPPPLQPNSSTILEQILEWNYRFAKESAGNLSLSIVQQKLLESQVLAAQLMSQQCSQPSGFGMNGMMPLTANFQEYFKMRGGAGGTGFSRVETVSGENKFGQR